MSRSLFDAYLGGEARRFFGSWFLDSEDRRAAVARAKRPLAPAVADALVSQNARLAPSPARDRNLDALRNGAAAVVTGQQVGLFLGPLYTLYKALSAVRLAERLEAETGTRVVPIFWLQTEDHDLPEIAETWIPSKEGPIRLAVPCDARGRVAVAHCSLPAEIDDCLAEIQRVVGHVPGAEEHLARLAKHYRAGQPWAAAFAGLLSELLADTGLVFVDPRDPALAAVTREMHRKAIEDAGPIANALLQRCRELRDAGFEPGIHVRADAPLSFFHPEGATGPRFRLEHAERGFAAIGGTSTHTPSELVAALDAEPLRFSTSALLRPILQDTLLPTAAYVGGPAEVAYFAQLAPLYAAFGMTPPLVVPRARFRLVDAKAARLLERLGLRPADAAKPEASLLAACRSTEHVGADDVRNTLQAALDAALRDLTPRLESAGPEMTRALAKTRSTLERAAGRLAARYGTTLARSDQSLVDDVHRLKALLHPNDAPQERIYGVPVYAARLGEQTIVDAVLRALDPLDPTVKDLHP